MTLLSSSSATLTIIIHLSVFLHPHTRIAQTGPGLDRRGRRGRGRLNRVGRDPEETRPSVPTQWSVTPSSDSGQTSRDRGTAGVGEGRKEGVLERQMTFVDGVESGSTRGGVGPGRSGRNLGRT